ncbi:hypothetical protein [Natronobiforma cellulositropha]|uniref:hypothetical protein n=1 Tax=Natronobiforma cellulositropha TaxID=1679076 RepID=UPI0021D590B4|nr:hypothetical protein [Natronobiforma cellulositropha]
MIDEVEPINQARRFAKYWVYRERGYDTLSLNENPHRIAAVALVLAALEKDAIEEHFTDLYLQVASHYGDTEPPVALPDGARPTHVTYRTDVYLGFTDGTLASLANAVSDPDAAAFVQAARRGEVERSLESILSGVCEHEALELVLERPASDWIEAVSGVHVHWDDLAGVYHTEWGDQPSLERDPDARIDLLPYNPDSLEEFRAQLVRVLCCQVRDCYLGMGIAPPMAFRLQGHGIHEFTTWYEHYDFYDRYHDPNATIGTWYEEHTPEGVYDLPAFANGA